MKESDWVSVKDHLPKEGEIVFAHFKHGVTKKELTPPDTYKTQKIRYARFLFEWEVPSMKKKAVWCIVDAVTGVQTPLGDGYAPTHWMPVIEPEMEGED